MATEFRLGHRPELDGLRGVAIGLVLFGHLFGFPRGGFLGVDLFFVLSGFLITSLLLEEARSTGTVSLRDFYARRALRLLPALLALCVVLLALGGFGTGGPGDPAAKLHGSASRLWNWRVGPELWYTLFYCQNLAVVQGWASTWGPLGVTWSLAIEEQFYLLWPGLLWLLMRRGWTGRRLAGTLAALVAVTVGWRLALALQGASKIRLYYGSDVRADGILLGCLLAVLFAENRVPPACARALPLAACLLALTALTAEASPAFVAFGMFPTCCAFALVVAAVTVRPRGAVWRLLRLAPLCWLGRVSYGLYLWHWPVRLWFQPAGTLPSAFTGWPALVVSLLACALSFYGLERPCLRLKDRFKRVPQGPPPTRQRGAMPEGPPVPEAIPARVSGPS